MDFQGDLKDDDRTPDHPTTCENSARRFLPCQAAGVPETEPGCSQRAPSSSTRDPRIQEEESVYKNRLRFSLYHSSYYKEHLEQMMEDLKALQVSLDKLTFANKRSLIKAVGLNTTPEEVDDLGLRFGMVHGSSKLADERKISKKTRLTRRKTNSRSTLEGYDCMIRELQSSVRCGSAMEEQRILREITELKLARDVAVQTAVCKGEMWESLGDKDGIQKKIKIRQEDIEASRAKAGFASRQFEATAKDLARLEKQVSHAEGIVGGAFKCLFRWRNKHQQANARYNQNVSLLNDARELAEKKDVASLRSLCERQTAMFMEKWNNDGDFRNDYKRRASISTACAPMEGRGSDPIAVGWPNREKTEKAALQSCPQLIVDFLQRRKTSVLKSLIKCQIFYPFLTMLAHVLVVILNLLK